MPKVDDVGFGDLTPLKIEHLARIYGMHLAVTQAVLNRYSSYRRQYRYVDLTAGKGHTPDGLAGSPLVFLEQVAANGLTLSYRADFIECVQANLEELRAVACAEAATSQGRGELHFHHDDYRARVRTLFPSLDTRELGLVFADPSGDPPDFQALKYVARMRPRMEILIYVSTTNIKRLFPYREKLLSDYMSEIGKQYWLIRKPISWDRHKWTFLLGSGSSLFKDYRKIDFLRLDSEEAQEFFPKLNLSTKQRHDLAQPPLL